MKTQISIAILLAALAILALSLAYVVRERNLVSVQLRSGGQE